MLAVFNSRQKWLLIHVSVSLCRILLLEYDDGTCKTNIAIEKVGDGGCQHQVPAHYYILRDDSLIIDLELALCRWYKNGKKDRLTDIHCKPGTEITTSSLCENSNAIIIPSIVNLFYFELWRGCTVTVMPVRLNNIMQFPT